MAILSFVRAHLAQYDYPPTVREIGAELGMRSPSTVHEHLKRLEAKGYVVRDLRGGPRTLRVTHPGSGQLPRRPQPACRVPPAQLAATEEQDGANEDDYADDEAQRATCGGGSGGSAAIGEQLVVRLGDVQRSLDTWELGGFGKAIKQRVMERDGFRCYICGREQGLHVHHVVPRSQGGSHSMANLVTLCSGCHRSVECGDVSVAVRQCVIRATKGKRQEAPAPSAAADCLNCEGG